MAFTTAITPAASATRTSSGSAAHIDLGSNRVAHVTLAVTAFSGTATPRLACVLETSDDALAWTQAGAFATTGAVGSESIYVGDLRRYLRVRWTLTGTDPSFTFSVAGESVLVYADPSDLHTHGIPSVALTSISMGDKVQALIAATDEMDGRFNDRYTFPLIRWGFDLRKNASAVAAAALMLTRGLAPEENDYRTMLKLRDDGYQWASDVGAKKIAPPGIVDSTPAVDEGGPILYTSAKRGW
jgi:hypothetical protein